MKNYVKPMIDDEVIELEDIMNVSGSNGVGNWADNSDDIWNIFD